MNSNYSYNTLEKEKSLYVYISVCICIPVDDSDFPMSEIKTYRLQDSVYVKKAKLDYGYRNQN